MYKIVNKYQKAKIKNLEFGISKIQYQRKEEKKKEKKKKVTKIIKYINI